MVTIVNQWTAAFSRDPDVFGLDYAPLATTAVPVANTAGHWLFAFASWRQDAGVAGTLQYPSTVTICDDAHNFWIPVESGQPATEASSSPSTGIVRCAVWMAPAARAAEFIYVSPTAYQAAMTVLIVELTGNCPWYEVSIASSTFTNQGTSITQSQTTSSGVFQVGLLAWDVKSASVTVTSTGWTALDTVSTDNGNADTTGDLVQHSYYVTSTGATQTLAGSSGTTMDWAATIVAIQGVSNTLSFPYAQPLENWPVLITEIASGPVLNANPLMLNGTTDWTGTNASVAAVTWPVYQPYPNYQNLITPSISVTPTGSATTAAVTSETEAITPSTQYSVLAYVYSQVGYAGGGFVPFINWYTSGLSFISQSFGATTTPIKAGEWYQVTFNSPVYPPGNAAYAACGVTENAASGDVPSSAVFFVGYCALTVADAYEGIPPDQITWTDFSSRNFTEASISIRRGIQFEQQSLEAGTMTVTLANNDFEVMYGNVESPYWPNIGDTDVPIRLRAIWPQSVTPYYVLFSGYTDDVDFGFNTETRYAWASFECSDVWSRLTQQMLGGAEQDVLEDGPVGYWVCSFSGANTAPGGLTPVVSQPSSNGPGTGTTVTFASDAIQVLGDQGVSCWQVTLGASVEASQGYSLTYFPPGGAQALPPLSGGITVDFWMSFAGVASADQPSTEPVIIMCWAGSGPAWWISVDNNSGPSGSVASINVVDKVTRAITSTTLGTTTFLGATSSAATFYFAISFTQTAMTVAFATGGITERVNITCNLDADIVGFSWAGSASPYTSGAIPTLASYVGFCTMAVYGIGLYGYLLPQARMYSHFEAGEYAYASEPDTDRLARIAGYSGFIPALGMRGTDLGATGPAADIDIITPASDCSGQVVSDYFTNIAQSALAFQFVDGPGALHYRRRLEAYNRVLGQAAAGEDNPVPINANGSFNQGTTGWATLNGGTVSAVTGPSGAPSVYFYTAGLFAGNGSTANPQLIYGSATRTPVTVGDYYTLAAYVWSPQGYSTGLTLELLFLTSGNSIIETISTATIPVEAGSLTYLYIPAQRAPNTAAYAWALIQAAGTPPSTTGFYVTDVILALQNTVTSGGTGLTAPETPYLVDTKLSSDRSQMFNNAILTQYGTDTKTTNSGTDLLFTPTSGITVTITNQKSAALRGSVPYTATLYTNNTAQALPYYLDEPSMEDFGNWITQTLGSPLFRPLTVAITPSATGNIMTAALQTEIGDTSTYRRRHLGVPEVQILSYVSKISHDISIADGHWQTKYELSPFPYGTVLQCDNVFQGTLTGGNYMGF